MQRAELQLRGSVGVREPIAVMKVRLSPPCFPQGEGDSGIRVSQCEALALTAKLKRIKKGTFSCNSTTFFQQSLGLTCFCSDLKCTEN